MADVINLQIKGNSIDVTPYDLATAEGQDVEFSAGDLPFKIIFHEDMPNPLNADVSHRVKKAKVKHGTGGNRRYRYAIAIYSKDKDEVFLLADCPSIIVN